MLRVRTLVLQVRKFALSSTVVPVAIVEILGPRVKTGKLETLDSWDVGLGCSTKGEVGGAAPDTILEDDAFPLRRLG